MNKATAKIIAETITNDQIKKMFDNAKTLIKDWELVSHVNKGMTKGTAWNILAKDFDISKSYHILAKKNMIREFGNFLPKELLPKSIGQPVLCAKPVHQNPQF